jgi:hypothetical protein
MLVGRRPWGASSAATLTIDGDGVVACAPSPQITDVSAAAAIITDHARAIILCSDDESRPRAGREPV